LDEETMALAIERVAAVVIGRNEGELLKLGLNSVVETKLNCVYVDSGSSDGSRALAAKIGIPVVELDPSRPFSAARARNEGVGEVRRRWPASAYVIFLDGDCELDRDFPAAAVGTFEQHPTCAIVTGHLSERHPEASIYNRLCAVEWRSPPGLMENFAALGGIMAARLSALAETGGFNEQVIAGEDSELGVRMSLHGYQVLKLDVPMAIHDARMFTFRAWWTRSVRAGHAIAQRYFLNGTSRLHDCRRELLSALLWGLVVPLLSILLVWPTDALSLLLLGGYGVLGFRIYRHYRRTGLQQADALLVTRFNLYAKFANLIGVVRYGINRLRGRLQIIEYK
jgi:GT2 family glycosyltransferase